MRTSALEMNIIRRVSTLDSGMRQVFLSNNMLQTKCEAVTTVNSTNMATLKLLVFSLIGEDNSLSLHPFRIVCGNGIHQFDKSWKISIA